MPIFSKSLGVTGACDVVEFHRSEEGVSLHGIKGLFLPTPVEYKRGKPKENEEDILQLVAQAMCLEEMLLCDVTEGYIFYGEINRRVKIEIKSNYRDKVSKICAEMHQLYQRRHTPKVKTGKHCKACSLSDLCLPKLCSRLSASHYIERSISE